MTDHKCDAKRSPDYSPIPIENSAGANGTFYIANTARLWASLLRSRKEKENVFRRGLPAPANADELLWTERHVDEGREQVTMPGNGRSTGWNFTLTKFNFFASSCPRKRDRTSRKDWISSLNVRNGGEVAKVVEADRTEVCANVGVRWERQYERTWPFSVERAKNEDSVRGGRVIEYQSFEIPRCQQSSLENITYK